MVFSKNRAQRTSNVITNDGLQYIADYFTNLALVQFLQWKMEAQYSIDNGLNSDLEQALPYILVVDEWKKAVNKKIVENKSKLAAGYTYENDFSEIGDPPVTFTQIYLAGHPSDRPEGWIAPDITGYEPGIGWTPPSED